jgi:hypothetical protein
MPARIIVRAELASLLGKAQELTDANRLAQLGAEQRRRAELAQLAAKRQKEEKEATRRKQLENPVMRSRRTAAMGQSGPYPVAAGHWTFVNYNEGSVGGSTLITSELYLASGDGSAALAVSTLFAGRRFVQNWSLGADSVELIVLPSAGTNELFFAVFADSYGFTSGAYSEITPTAKYIRVTHTTVEEVSIPGLPFGSALSAVAASGYNLGTALSAINLSPNVFPDGGLVSENMPPQGDSDNPPNGLYYGFTATENALTPAIYTIVDVFDGGDRDTLLAAAPNSSLWYPNSGLLSRGLKAKPGTTRPARLPQFDGNDPPEWITALAWDGGVPGYCTERLTGWGYVP